MQNIDRNTFFKITREFAHVPVTQSEGWWAFNSVKNNDRFLFFVDSLENPSVACMAYSLKRMGIKMLQIAGECTRENKEEKTTRQKERKLFTQLSSFYEGLTKIGYNIIEIQSDTEWDFNYEMALRQAGYLRPVGLFSTTTTRLIDLNDPIRYDRNWERNIRKSNTYGLEFEVLQQVEEEDCRDFCRIYNSMCERKSIYINSRISPKQIEALCGDPSFRLFFVNDKGRRISAIIVHIDTKTGSAQGIFAGSSEEALNKRASFFMYKELFDFLQDFCKIYDMAKLTPSGTGKLFQFKNGIEGRAVQLNGEFAWYQRSYYRLMMYFVKKHLMKKREV